MRAAIKARLADQLSAIGGRCFDFQEASDSTVKPFATVRWVKQIEGPPWLGFIRKFRVSLYAEPDAAAGAVLEELAAQTIQALDGVRLSEGAAGPDFTCRFECEAYPERLDNDLQAVVRVLTFAVIAVGHDDASSQSSSNGALEALCEWTADTAGGEWNVYRQQWPRGYAAPAILWRIGQIECLDRGAATIELRQKAVGHVLGRTDAEEQAMVGALAAGLARTTKLVVDPVGNRQVALSEVAGNYQADALSEGQLTVTLRQKLPKPSPTGPLIADVHYDGGFD